MNHLVEAEAAANHVVQVAARHQAQLDIHIRKAEIDQTVATAPAADDEGIAHGLPPAPATAETVGAGSFGIQNSGDFAAPQSLRGKESAYKTVERSPVDVMQQRQVASAPFGIAADLSALPGRIDLVKTGSAPAPHPRLDFPALFVVYTQNGNTDRTEKALYQNMGLPDECL